MTVAWLEAWLSTALTPGGVDGGGEAMTPGGVYGARTPGGGFGA